MVEIDWNLENTEIICKLFAGQVERGNRPNTHLNSVGYTEVEKGFIERTGIEISRVQIKNKWDKLKEDYKAWRKLMLWQTGTGWCDVKGTIVMDDEWWKKARADIPGCEKFRKLGLQNESQLRKMFGDIVSVGAEHWSPHMANVVAPPPSGDTSEDAFNFMAQKDLGDTNGEGGEVGEISPSIVAAKRKAMVVPDKGKKPKTGSALLIQEAVTSMASSANEYASKKLEKNSIEEVMDHVLACGANYDTDEYFIASELFVKKE